MPLDLTEPSVKLAILSAGVFFTVGLITGIWKYAGMMRSRAATAHPYVDIAHRASLLYAFAAQLLALFASVSELPDAVELIATAAPLAFFALAILTYVVHGALRDTENQLKEPHRLGRRELPRALVRAFMFSLIAAELGGFLVLFYGVAVRLL